MRSRLIPTAVLVVLLLGACTPPEASPSTEPPSLDLDTILPDLDTRLESASTWISAMAAPGVTGSGLVEVAVAGAADVLANMTTVEYFGGHDAGGDMQPVDPAAGSTTILVNTSAVPVGSALRPYWQDIDGLITATCAASPIPAAPDGGFTEVSVELPALTGAQQDRGGVWRFAVTEAAANCGSAGAADVPILSTLWPVTDAVAEVRATDATTSSVVTPDGTVVVPAGTEFVELRSEDAVLATARIGNGVVRSFGQAADGADTIAQEGHAYDQALAVFAALSVRDEPWANDLTATATFVDGLLAMQNTDETSPAYGAFAYAAPQLRPGNHEQIYYTGAHAIAVDALLAYAQSNPAEAPRIEDAARIGIGFVERQLSSSGPTAGLYRGGLVYGDQVPWANFEHNSDAFHMFTRACSVLAEDAYCAEAERLASVMTVSLWDEPNHRLQQSAGDDEDAVAWPLDSISWGSVFLLDAGYDDMARENMDEAILAQYRSQDGERWGYRPYVDQIELSSGEIVSGGYSQTVETIWYEGSFSVALARYRLGDAAEYTDLLRELVRAQDSSGAYLYVTRPDARNGLVDREAVGSTAWFVLATAGRDVIWPGSR